MPSLQYNNLFITDPMNYSHDEKVVDYALYCGIAKIIGVATAGCNGLVNRIPLPFGGIFNSIQQSSYNGSNYKWDYNERDYELVLLDIGS